MRRHMIGNRAPGALAALAAALLVACGFTQTAGIQGSGAPVATTSTVSGPITGFGSVFVNGVEYATSAAQITINGQSGTEAQLRAGEIVTLQGTVNSDGTTGAATTLNLNCDYPVLDGKMRELDAVVHPKCGHHLVFVKFDGSRGDV